MHKTQNKGKENIRSKDGRALSSEGGKTTFSLRGGGIYMDITRIYKPLMLSADRISPKKFIFHT